MSTMETDEKYIESKSHERIQSNRQIDKSNVYIIPPNNSGPKIRVIDRLLIWTERIAILCLLGTPVVLIADFFLGIPVMPDLSLIWITVWGPIFLLSHIVRGFRRKSP